MNKYDSNELTDSQLDGVVGGGILGDAWNWVKDKASGAKKAVQDGATAAAKAIAEYAKNSVLRKLGQR